LKHFLHFLNGYSDGFSEALTAELQIIARDKNGKIGEARLVPKSLLVWEVFDKFITYLVDHATFDLTEDGEQYSIQTCDTYFSAVKTYFVMHHPKFKAQDSSIPKVFGIQSWAKARALLTKKLKERLVIDIICETMCLCLRSI